MKRTLLQITTGVITITTATSALSVTPITAEDYHGYIAILTTEQKQHIDDRLLKVIILRRCYDSMSIHEGEILSKTLQDIVRIHEIPSERVTQALEDLIRERLPILENTPWEPGMREGRIAGGEVIDIFIRQLSEFTASPSTNTLALLKECAMSRDIGVRTSALSVYIDFTGGGEDSVPLLREVIAKGLQVYSPHSLYEHLGNFIVRLKEGNKTADVEKILAFMKDMVQTEQDLSATHTLDHILCANVDGYADSHQRTNVLNRIKVLEREVREQIEQREKRTQELNERLRREREKEREEREQKLLKLKQIAQMPTESKTLMDDETLKKDLLWAMSFYEFKWDLTTNTNTTNEPAMEQMIRVLESIVREGLALIGTIGFPRKTEKSLQLWNSIEFLEIYHSANTLALIREMILCEDKRLNSKAMSVYIDIAGAESLPFFREIISDGRLDGENRSRLYQSLEARFDDGKISQEEVSYRILKKGSDETKACYAFLKDMAQTESNVGNARRLDEILCARFEDYKDSPARTNVLGRIRQLDPMDGQPRIINMQPRIIPVPE